MKKRIDKEVTFCDGCKKETYITACLTCGVEYCWECRRVLGVEYKHSCYASGSGDGYYCNGCHYVLLKQAGNKLFNAYRLIANLRRENELFYDDWKKRSDKAESDLKHLQR